MIKILIVEDSEEIRDILRILLLGQKNTTVYEAQNLEEAVSQTNCVFPDIIILDLNLPDGSGTTLCKKIRSNPDIYGTPAIIALTADTRQESVNNNLISGCDGYITKPFNHSEFIIRINKFIDRVPKKKNTTLILDNIKIEMNKKEVVYDGEIVSLSKNEFSILEYFVINRGILLSKPKILNYMWNDDFDVSEKAIDQCLKRLRKKIPLLKENIVAKRGFGYMLK